MLFKGQSHVGITVKNLDKSLYFYHDVLGLEFSQEPSGWNDEPWLGKAVGVPGGVLRQTCLRLGDTLIELLEYKAPKSDTEAPMPSNNVGASHIGFEVADIFATKTALEAKGIKFNSDVNVVDEGLLAGWRWVYFSDPDGYPLELVQYAYERPQEELKAGVAAYLAGRPGQ
jgi:catechol 2,3-dioxygenase-like lactoylglutathione lyase family enzyme